MLAWIKSLPIGISFIVLQGCAWPGGRTCCCRPPAAPQLACREVEPLPVVVDLSLLPATRTSQRVHEQYCALAEMEAQCLAARNSKTGRLLAMEAEAVAAQKHCVDGGSELAGDLLVLQSVHERNKDAATVMELFLRLVEAEGGAQNLGLRLQEVEAMQADVDQLQQRGMTSAVSKSEIETQRLEILHRQAEVQGTIDRLNHQLANMLGVVLPPGSRYWPEADLLVDPNQPDPEEAVQVGLGNRADLAALRRASRAEGREAVAAAKLLLQPPGVGAATAVSSDCLKLFQLCSQRREADAREDQLSLARWNQERTVESEVLQAMDLMGTRLLQIGITRDRGETIQTRLEATRRRQQLVVSPLSVRTIGLDALAAEQDLLHDVVEWKIAIVRFKQAQGLLARECGWGVGCR